MNLKNEISKLRSLSELNELSSFVEDCKTMLGKMSLTIGAKVWVVQKTKKTEGVITKINQKKCHVDMSGKIYTVPMSMLELA
jgi:hypothetical protein